MDRNDLKMVLNSFENFYKDMIQKESHVCAWLDFENEAGWLEDEGKEFRDKEAFKDVYGLVPLKRDAGNFHFDLNRKWFREGFVELDSSLIVPNRVARVLRVKRIFYEPPTRRMAEARRYI